MFVYGVLEGDYKDGISVKDGVELALKGINSSIKRDVASGNGIIVMTITDKGVQKVLEKEIDAHIDM